VISTGRAVSQVEGYPRRLWGNAGSNPVGSFGLLGKAESVELWLHKATGNWCKKHRGKFFYFGKDKEQALVRFRAEWEAMTVATEEIRKLSMPPLEFVQQCACYKECGSTVSFKFTVRGRDGVMSMPNCSFVSTRRNQESQKGKVVVDSVSEFTGMDLHEYSYTMVPAIEKLIPKSLKLNYCRFVSSFTKLVTNYFSGERKPSTYETHDGRWWERIANPAVLLGKWKLTQVDRPWGTLVGPMRFFDAEEIADEVLWRIGQKVNCNCSRCGTMTYCLDLASIEVGEARLCRACREEMWWTTWESQACRRQELQNLRRAERQMKHVGKIVFRKRRERQSSRP
jgi:hypothetical protein